MAGLRGYVQFNIYTHYLSLSLTHTHTHTPSTKQQTQILYDACYPSPGSSDQKCVPFLQVHLLDAQVNSTNVVPC